MPLAAVPMLICTPSSPISLATSKAAGSQRLPSDQSQAPILNQRDWRRSQERGQRSAHRGQRRRLEGTGKKGTTGDLPVRKAHGKKGARGPTAIDDTPYFMRLPRRLQAAKMVPRGLPAPPSAISYGESPSP